MRRLLSSLLLSSVLISSAPPLPIAFTQPVRAQTGDELYYTFYNQRIPLSLRRDRIAVAFKPQPGTRLSNEPTYLRLQNALRGEAANGTRSAAPAANEPALDVTVQPLGNQYAVIQLPELTAELETLLQERLQQTYVDSTLPVLSRPDTDETIVLPNQILISFEAGTPESQVQLTLSRYSLEVVRPLRFAPHRYLVRSRRNLGTGILNVANQLNGIAGVQSATPNFVQTASYGVDSFNPSDRRLSEPPQRPSIDSQLSRLSVPENAPVSSDLLPLQWHLDSTAFRGQRQPRTDIRAVEAWQQGVRGEGVVVAVIDSLIQWDHPDLQQSRHAITGDRLPGEVNGWDFSSQEITCSTQDAEDCAVGDPDTRISQAELDILRPHPAGDRPLWHGGSVAGQGDPTESGY
ncbi:MAG: hypothetical protein F6K04_21725, partial [Leptolyngbya sp. SIO4C5]|nr:hypothetical protein [Leptolyngbya sp. SIO4C5]